MQANLGRRLQTDNPFEATRRLNGLTLNPFFGRNLSTCGYVVTPMVKGIQSVTSQFILRRSASLLMSDVYNQSIQRMIESAQLFSGLSPSSNAGRIYCLELPEKAVLDDDVRCVLRNGAERLAKLGCSLAILIEVRGHGATPRAGNPLLDALFDLREAGVSLHLRADQDASVQSAKVLLRSEIIDTVHVSIEAIGANRSERELDHTRLIKTTTRITDWMHNYACKLLLCDIETAWEAEVAQGIPAYYFQGSHFCAPGRY